ncbi:MAG TPA: hypothetical protein VKX25_07535 [Bryobacteraceae bacterium]|nr:hypothetical protein [Bryobacteraceae bacterium]
MLPNPFALDAPARIAALERARVFDSIDHQSSAWTLVLNAEQTVALYATYSNINIRADSTAVLSELRRIAVDGFKGRVTRSMMTSLYVARRRP